MFVIIASSGSDLLSFGCHCPYMPPVSPWRPRMQVSDHRPYTPPVCPLRPHMQVSDNFHNPLTPTCFLLRYPLKQFRAGLVQCAVTGFAPIMPKRLFYMYNKVSIEPVYCVLFKL